MSIIYINSYQFAAAPPSGYDPDAQAYIAAVEAADAAAGSPGGLETAVKDAINAFVVGCKADGIWSAIKASCILAGARTLSGALVPLAGAAPTNPGGVFVSADYDRKTGLKGNGSTKYLDSNRNNNADPQNSKHVSVYISATGNLGFLGSGAGTSPGITQLYNSAGNFLARNNETTSFANIGPLVTGLIGTSRDTGTSYTALLNGAKTPVSSNSASPNNANILLFNLPTLTYFSNARLAFYSIGEALDLALLDARVTALINAFAAAIP